MLPLSILSSTAVSELERALISDLGVPLDFIEIQAGAITPGALGAAAQTRLAVGKRIGSRTFITLSAGFCPNSEVNAGNFGTQHRVPVQPRLARPAQLRARAELLQHQPAGQHDHHEPLPDRRRRLLGAGVLVARALLITNPAAARTEPLAVNAVMDTLRARGWQAEVLATGGPGDARRLAEYGVEQGVDVVAVFGGDGTTMQAAAALVGSDVALGVIPGGTGNLLAGNLRIPPWPARAADVLTRGRSRRLDLGRMSRDGGTQYFAVACGAGMDARVMAGTASERKRRWGMGAYVATTLRLISQVRSTPYHVTVDGMEYDANAAMILVANCGEVIPPFVKLKSGIRPDDGLLDVIVLRADNFGPEPPGGVGPAPRARGARRPRQLYRLRPGRGDHDLDGRGGRAGPARRGVGGETPFTATVVPGAIRIMVP